MRRPFSLLRLLQTDALILLIASVALTILMVKLDAFDHFVAFTVANEDWELDELATALCATGGLGYVLMLRYVLRMRKEIQLREAAENEARHMANHDALTGLPNRLALQTHCIGVLAELPERFYVSILDVDGFKAINDLFGHATGDRLLREIASRLRLHIRAPNFVCRLSGDEFAIVLRQPVEQQSVRALIETLGHALKQPARINNYDVRVSATFGLACYPDDGQNLTQLLRRADIALYQGKSLNRCSIRFYNAALDQQIEERSRTEIALRAALDNNRLHLNFQPIVELDTGQIVAFEALARLYDPDTGWIPPIKFIEAAEHSGMILRLSEHLLHLACRSACQWPEHISLTFNLSPIELNDQTLVERITTCVTQSGLAPQRLIIEVTESAIIPDADRTASVFQRLRAYGIRLALDDFGTGYSSLTRLLCFSFDRIKIDRSFVQEIGHDERGEALLASVIHLADTLATNGLAEGIETQAQREWLLAHGCHYGQGYLFSPPVPDSGVTRLLEAPFLPRAESV